MEATRGKAQSLHRKLHVYQLVLRLPVYQTALNQIARFHLTDSFRRAGEYEVAHFQREIFAYIGNQVVKLEDHQVGLSLLSQFVVHFTPELQVLVVRNLLARYERAHRTGGVERLGDAPRRTGFLGELGKKARNEVWELNR